MATRYVGTSATGNGSGSDPSNRMTLPAALSAAAAGDVVRIAFGYYTNTMNPSNAGTSNSARITFEAEDSANKPIITGASTASNGLSAPAFINSGWSNSGTGLSGGVLAYGGSGFNSSGSAHPYVYRRTGFSNAINGVWVNHPTDGASPTGYYHSLWRMHQDQTYSNQVPRNPDLRIHDPNEHAGGATDDAGTGFYKRHDWQAQCRWNGAAGNTWGFPADSLDVRLHSTSTPNPNNWNIIVTTKGRVLDLDKNFITFRNLIFKHWAGMQTNAANFTMDGCEVHQMANDALNIAVGSNNAQIINCRIIGGGAWMHHGHDTMYISDSNDCLVQNCEIAYGAHGGLTTLGAVARLTVRGCTFHHTGTALSAQKPGCANWLIENNTFYNSAFIEEINILKTPHPAIEIDVMNGAVIRRNRFMRCSYGLLIQCPANSGGSVTGVDFRHNTIVDCQIASVRIQTDGGLAHDNTFRNNIFVGPSGGDITPRSTYLYGGHGANVNFDGSFSNSSTGDNNTFRNNLYFERVPPDGNVPLAAKVFSSGTNFASVLGGSGAANTLPNIFGPTSFNGLASDTDPLFVDRANDNLALQSGSPAIGKGQVIAGETGTDLGYAQFSGTPSPTNTAPSLNLTANPPTGTAPFQCNFNANASDPPNSDNSLGTADASLQYSWNFGDPGSAGNTLSGTGKNTLYDGTHTYDAPVHTYANPGTYSCTVTVTDSGTPIGPQKSTQAQVGVTVGNGASGTEITSGLTATGFGANGADQTGQTPDKLVDQAWASFGGGVAGTNNAARSNLLTTPQGWVVDIGHATTLTRVLVSHYPGGGGTRNYNFTLATSPDNSTYTAIGTADTVLPGTNEFSEISFAQRTNVRYVRLTVNSATPAFDVASFWEMRLFELPSANNAPNITAFTATPQSGTAPLAVQFDATATDDNTTFANLTFAWDFGDSTSTTGGTNPTTNTRRVSKTYNAVGTYTAVVTVTDASTPALSASSNLTVTVSAVPVNNNPVVNLTPSTQSILAGGTASFTSTTTDETTQSLLQYVWSYGDGSANDTGANIPNRTHIYSTVGTYTCQVTVTDNGSPQKSTTKSCTVIVTSSNANTWPLVEAWDNLNTPAGTPFAPDRTLQLKNVTDGDPSARWVSPIAIVNGQTFIAWDLGANRQIKRLRFQMGKSINGFSYTITAQQSLDKINWTNFTGIVNVTTATNVYFSEYVLATPVTARYIRLVFLSSSNGCATSWAPVFSDT